MSAQLKVLPRQAPNEGPSLDDRIEALCDRWDEAEAIAIGQELTTHRSDLEDLIQRNRAEENRRDTENAFRLAYWTLAVMQKYGPGWYDWMLIESATTLDKQTLYQYKSELLRVKPELRQKYGDKVNSAVMRAAATLPNPEAQDNLLGVAAAIRAPAAAVREAARVMRKTKSTEVPAFIHGYKRDTLADEPSQLTELWAAYTEMVSDAREQLVKAGMSHDAAMSWALKWNARGQMIVRGK